MMITSLPYSEVDHTTTTSRATPYGARHYAGADSKLPISEEEKRLCRALGRRLAETARTLAKCTRSAQLRIHARGHQRSADIGRTVFHDLRAMGRALRALARASVRPAQPAPTKRISCAGRAAPSRMAR